MPTQEQINAANVELDIANDNYARLADQYNRYQNVFQSYANASPETQEEAKGLMQDALAKYEQLKLDMYAAEDRIQQAQGAVNRLNAEVKAAQEAAAATRAYRGGGGGGGNGGGEQRTYTIDFDPVGYSSPLTRPDAGRMSYGRKATVTPVVQENWEDLYNSGGWNEFKKGFNNALVDDLVLPVAGTFGASDDTLGILSELKIPATEREQASKYYALGGWGKDAADAYLQYAGMKGLGSIPKLVGRGAGTTYTVANSGRGIYNTPNARRTVNRAGSNYTPAYWGNGVRNLKSSGLPNLSFTSLG